MAESIRSHVLVGHEPFTSRALNHISKDAVDQGKKIEPEISLQVPDLLCCLEVCQVKLGHSSELPGVELDQFRQFVEPPFDKFETQSFQAYFLCRVVTWLIFKGNN